MRMVYFDNDPLHNYEIVFPTSMQIVALDENVGSMLGYHPDTDSVFAIATDRRSCMVSEDKGDSWFSVPPSRWEEVKLLPGSRKAIGVPFLSKSTIQTNSAQYISGNWAGNYILNQLWTISE